MKLHHTAALAVAGWYLMMPPFGSNGRRDDSAPLPQWKIRGSFDTAVECADALAEQLGMTSQKWYGRPFLHPGASQPTTRSLRETSARQI